MPFPSAGGIPTHVLSPKYWLGWPSLDHTFFRMFASYLFVRIYVVYLSIYPSVGVRACAYVDRHY